jgi:hypothetical protein
MGPEGDLGNQPAGQASTAKDVDAKAPAQASASRRAGSKKI